MLAFFCLSILILTLNTQEAYGCADVVPLWDKDSDNVKPKIIYNEKTRNEVNVYCDGQDLGVVELVSDRGSLGVIEKRPIRMICRLGRWYALNKHREITPVKEVACIVHSLNYLY